MTTTLDNFQIESNISQAIKPFNYISSIFGVSSLTFSGKYIQPLKWYHKVYALFMIICLAAIILTVPPSNIVYSLKELPLLIITLTSVTCKILETFYMLFSTNFLDSKYVLRIYEYLEITDNLLLSRKSILLGRKKLRRFVIIMTIGFAVLYLCGFLTWKLTSKAPSVLREIPLLYIVFSTTVYGGLLLYMLINIILRFKLLNFILLSQAKRYYSDKTFPFENKTTLLDVMFSFFFTPSFMVVGKEFFSLGELLKVFDSISESLRLFNEVHGLKLLIMVINGFLTILLLIVRTISTTVTTSLWSDLSWFFILNCRILMFAILSDILQAECYNTWLIVNDLLAFDVMGRESREELSNFISLVQTHKSKVTAVFFDVDLQMILSFAGTSTSYSVLFLQSFYYNKT